MSGVDLMTDMARLCRELEQKIDALPGLGAQKAHTERAYRMAVKKQILILRAAGYPATMVGDLARGDDTVSMLGQERTIAEVLFDACVEAINATKLEIRVLDAQIAREYGR